MFAKLLTAEFAEGKEIAEKIVRRESDTSECGQLTALLSALCGLLGVLCG